jgi:hypothetical protein
VPSKCTCAGRNGLRESTDYRAKNFCTKRDEKARFYFSNDEMARGIFYFLFGVVRRRHVTAVSARHSDEDSPPPAQPRLGTRACRIPSRIAVEKSERAGMTTNS